MKFGRFATVKSRSLKCLEQLVWAPLSSDSQKKYGSDTLVL